MSVQLPHTHEPSGIVARQVNTIRKILVNSWKYDPEFFSKFFPITPHTRKIYHEMGKAMRRGQRWQGIPEKDPKFASKLYTPLRLFLNDVLLCFEIGKDPRRFLNTSRSRIHPYTNYPTWPPLFLAGCGSHFVNSTVSRPQPDYGFGISIIEVRLDSEEEVPSRDLLATNMQRMFAHQHSRRFAFGMVMSQCTLTLYMFDRSGVLFSPPLDYHSQPEQLFAVISGLTSTDATRIGFDPTISLDSKGRILTRESLGRKKIKEVTYTVYTILYHSAQFLTRGTVCWLVFEEAAPKQLYVIKDSWEPVGELEGRESEASLLMHAHSRGVMKGVVQLRQSEQVLVKGRTGRKYEVDTILGNRRADPNPALERVHTRIVISPYGKPLIHFSNRKELLVAYYDAIQAHRALHDVAGILHRDIKPTNILINPRGEEGNRGVLIDFDHAIRIDDTSPYSTKRKIGTYLFMSRNALIGEDPQTCLDDLESFYYVLLWLVLTYSGPESPEEDQELISEWKRPLAYMAKGGYFSDDFTEEIYPWFGQPFETLIKNLHAIFHHHRMQYVSAQLTGVAPPTHDPVPVYDAFLKHIRDAITQLDQEEIFGSSCSQSSGNEETLRTPKIARPPINEQYSLLYSWLQLSESEVMPQVNINVTAAAIRPWRTNVAYGFTKHEIKWRRSVARRGI